MKFLNISTIVLFILSFSNSAGFDCKRASTPTEKTICQHKYLSLADDAMSERHWVSANILTNMNQEKLTHPIMIKLQKTQKDFIKQRELCRTNQGCIYNLTIKRYFQIGSMFNWDTHATTATDMNGMAECDKIIAELEMHVAYEKLFNALNPKEKQKLALEQKKFYKDVKNMWEKESSWENNKDAMCANSYVGNCYEQEEQMMKKRLAYLKGRLKSMGL